MFTINTTDAQYAELKQATAEQFNTFDTPLTWEKEYVGKLDDRFTLHLYLETDTKLYKGAYIIASTGSLRLLEGEMQDDRIVLLEYDSDLNITGRIEGDFNDHIFYGIWKDKKELEEFSFVAYDPNYSLNTIGDNWSASYKNGKSIVIINKFHDQYEIKGMINNIPLLGYAECLDEKCKVLETILTSVSEEEQWSLKLTLTDINLTIEYFDDKTLVLKRSKLLNFEVLETPTQGEVSYEITPKFENDGLTSSWVKFVEKFLQSINSTPSAQDEKPFKSSTDITIDYLDNHYCSGLIRYQNNHYPRIKENGFVIDLQKDKVYNTATFLKGESITALIKSQLNAIKGEKKPNARAFHILSLGTNGVIAKTNMDIIYGQSQLVIPYSSLRKKILK